MNTDTPDTPTPDEIPAIKLGDAYDHCLLGATVRGNYAYSLKRLIEFEASNRRTSREKAWDAIRVEVVELMREHGALAPEFIDDTLMEDQGPRIVVPDFKRKGIRTGG